jgi:hypothetical protein
MLESACREITETEKWPDIAKVKDVIEEHVLKWGAWRDALYRVEEQRLNTIAVLLAREQEQQKEAHERAIRNATFAVKQWMNETQRLAKEIEAAKLALVEEVERRNARLAVLVQKHAESEKRESEHARELRALLPSDEQTQAEDPPAKLNGAAGQPEILV